MFFLYNFVIICNVTILLSTVNGYVILAGNFEDFTSLAKKFMPNELANLKTKIDELVQDNSGNHRRMFNNDQTDKYSEETEQNNQEHSFVVVTKQTMKAVSKPQPLTRSTGYQLKSSPVSARAPVPAPLMIPPGVSLNEIIEKVNRRLHIKLLKRAQVQVQAQTLNVQASRTRPLKAESVNVEASSKQVNIPQAANVLGVINPSPPKNTHKKSQKLTEAKESVENSVFNYKAPIRVGKEDVKYVETQEIFSPPKIKNQGEIIHSQKKFEHKNGARKQINNESPIKENRLENPQHARMEKKMRYVKQIIKKARKKERVEPMKPKKRQMNTLKQPRLVQPRRFWQQPRPVEQQAADQSFKQHQKEKLNRIAKKKALKNKQIKVTSPTVLQTPPTINTDAINANLESVPNPEGEVFEAVHLTKINDIYEDIIPSKDKEFESEATTIATFKPKIPLKNVIVPTVDEVEKIVNDTLEAIQDSAEVKYKHEATEATTEPKAKTESIPYEENQTKLDLNATTLSEAVTKQAEIGTMMSSKIYKIRSTKLPIIAVTYNFNEPIPEGDREPEILKPIGNLSDRTNGKIILL